MYSTSLRQIHAIDQYYCTVCDIHVNTNLKLISLPDMKIWKTAHTIIYWHYYQCTKPRYTCKYCQCVITFIHTQIHGIYGVLLSRKEKVAYVKYLILGWYFLQLYIYIHTVRMLKILDELKNTSQMAEVEHMLIILVHTYIVFHCTVLEGCTCT